METASSAAIKISPKEPWGRDVRLQRQGAGCFFLLSPNLCNRTGKTWENFSSSTRIQQVSERGYVKGIKHIPFIAGCEDEDRLSGRIALSDLAGQSYAIQAGGIQFNVQKEQVNLPVVCKSVTGRRVLYNLTGAALCPNQGRKVGSSRGFIISYHGDIPLSVYSFKWPSE